MDGGGQPPPAAESPAKRDPMNLAVNVENPLGFSGIRPAKWEMAANSHKGKVSG